MKHPHPVALPLSVARCNPLQNCQMAGHCARAQLKHEMNRPTDDFTRIPGWTPQQGCPCFLSASLFRLPPAGPKPIIHEPPKGLKL